MKALLKGKKHSRNMSSVPVTLFIIWHIVSYHKAVFHRKVVCEAASLVPTRGCSRSSDTYSDTLLLYLYYFNNYIHSRHLPLFFPRDGRCNSLKMSKACLVKQTASSWMIMCLNLSSLKGIILFAFFLYCLPSPWFLGWSVNC